MAEKKAGASKASTAASPQRKAGEWSEAADRVLRERYLLKDAQGVVIETPDDMAWRVAEAVASAEKQWTNKGGSSSDAIAEQFYSVMVERKFLPNSPTLMNAGKGNNLQLSACYVVPVEDSLPGIFEAVKHAALIHQSGGGTGFSFSRLRPEGSMVASTHGVASGPISFMKIFDGATEAVKQGGTRRGANMGILRVDHPDILKFIDCKRDGSVTNFNISVAITDTFMRALEANTEYELIEPHTNLVTGTLKARDVMDAIVSAAWATGDPGLVFIDRANASPANPVPEIEMLEATNPCVVGETRLATSDGLARMDALQASGERFCRHRLRAQWDIQRSATVNGSLGQSREGVVFHDAVPVFKSGTQCSGSQTRHRSWYRDYRDALSSLPDDPTATNVSTSWNTAMCCCCRAARALGLPSARCRRLPTECGVTSRLRAKIARGEATPPTEWTTELGEVVGYVLGDGYVRRGKTADIVGIAVAADDEALATELQARFTRWFGASGNVTPRHGHLQIQYAGSAATLLMGLGLNGAHAHEKRVPESIFAAPRDAVIGFLRGLFSADGSVQIGNVEKGTCSVRLATSSKGLAQDVQQLLLNFGIVSAIRLRREAQVRLHAKCRTRVGRIRNPGAV